MQVEAGGFIVNDGWMYASRAQTETLITSLWGGNIDRWSNDNAPGASWFTTNFGSTQRGGSFTDADVTNLTEAVFVFGNLLECDAGGARTCYGDVAAFDNSASDRFVRSYDFSTGVSGGVTYVANSGPGGFISDRYGAALPPSPFPTMPRSTELIRTRGSAPC